MVATLLDLLAHLDLVDLLVVVLVDLLHKYQTLRLCLPSLRLEQCKV